MTIGENLKKIRSIKKLTQKEISELLGINIRTYQKYESGDINPNLDTLGKISTILEVELDTLINGINGYVYDRDDVFELYYKLNTKAKLSHFLGFRNDYDMDFMAFKEALLGRKDLYLKLSNYLNLTENQLYNWVLSDTIYTSVGYDDFNVSNISKENIKIILKKNILIEQSIDSLLNEGLTKENEDLLKNFLTKIDNINLSKMKFREKRVQEFERQERDSINKIFLDTQLKRAEENRKDMYRRKVIDRLHDMQKEASLIHTFIQDIDTLENHFIDFKNKYLTRYNDLQKQLEDIKKDDSEIYEKIKDDCDKIIDSNIEYAKKRYEGKEE